MRARSKTWIVVPAFNEEKTIGVVIKGLKKHGWRNIIVIDDGSTDKTGEIAREQGVIVLRHVINRGLGAALGTGINAALLLGAEYIVTFDADNQHFPEDIERIVEPLIDNKADIVVGSRFKKKESRRNVPLKYRIGNLGLNIITFLLFGKWSTDTQSGLRGFTRRAASMITIRTNRMSVSSEIIAEAKRKKLRIIEVPINIRYPHQRQGFISGLRIISRLLLRRIGI